MSALEEIKLLILATRNEMAELSCQLREKQAALNAYLKIRDILEIKEVKS